MNHTIRHALPLIGAGQAQKEITHNEALLAIDARLHPVIETRALQVPPAAPAAGAAFIIPAGAEAAWGGAADSIATFDGIGWLIAAPVRGTLAWIADEGIFSVHDRGWSDGCWPVRAIRIGNRTLLAADPVVVGLPEGGEVVDVECRGAVKLLVSALREQGLVA